MDRSIISDTARETIVLDVNVRELARDLNTYREPSQARSVFELAVTIVPFAALWVAMWALLDVSYWISLALAVPAAGFLVRLFMIQHDCGHGSFMRRRTHNDWIGRVLGVLTFTPYDYWKRTHAIHHATSGNLDGRGIGDVETRTVSEYLAMSRFGRLRYRLYRHPAVLFGLGPAYLFMLQFRLPIGLMRKGLVPWVSTMATNAAIAAIAVAAMWLLGAAEFLAVQLPILLGAATAGVWLFYVQHQFDETSWASNVDWDVSHQALHGSSYYELPGILRWFSANIGVHHVHHLCSRVPFYRLPEVLRDRPELAAIGRLTLLGSLRCVSLTLWDEDRGRLISFAELRRRGVGG